MTDHFDIAVVGAGPGGYVAALKAAQLGAKVALVEKDHVGGTCLNRGCIPSKAFLAAAEMLHDIRHRAPAMGLKIAEPVHNWSETLARKNAILDGQRKGLKFLFDKRGVELFVGEGALEGPGRIVVKQNGTARSITASKVILASGSRPARIPGWPVSDRVVTSDEALDWAQLPKSLLIVGGGVIGVEFACMMAEFGVKVTVVEMLPRLVAVLDADLGAELHKIFHKRGIQCYVDTRVEDLSEKDEGVTVRLSSGETLQVEKVLVATGRRPNAENIGLDRVGIQAERGFVVVNDRLETNVAGHYAIGDLNGLMQLAHSASAMGHVAVENALGHPRRYTAPSPWCVYTFPEIAGVGRREEGARDAGHAIAVATFPFSASGKAQAYGDSSGFVKVVRDRETDEVLGVHALGHGATEFISSAAVMVHSRAKAREVAEMIFAHPTMSEAVKEAVEGTLFEGLHLPPAKTVKLTV